jgi:hypothetical protein
MDNGGVILFVAIMAYILLAAGEPSILDGWRAQANAQQCSTTDRKE